MTKVQIKPEKFTPFGGLFMLRTNLCIILCHMWTIILEEGANWWAINMVRYFSQWLAISSVGATYNYSKTKMLQK